MLQVERGTANSNILFLYPPHNKVVGGYTGLNLSVHPSVRPSVDRIVSSRYLPYYLRNHFNIWNHYYIGLEGVSRFRIFLNHKNCIFGGFSIGKIRLILGDGRVLTVPSLILSRLISFLVCRYSLYRRCVA